ncbi:MAG: glycosyltransferase family 4 protein [Acidimicrobiales bacterium]
MSLAADGAARTPLRLAVVMPRYHASTIGGAEYLCQDLALRLMAAGHSVEILTSCAVDHYNWRNELPAGVDHDGPLTIRRFPIDDRDLGIHGELERAIVSGYTLSREEERLWMRHGVASAALEDHLAGPAGRGFDAVLAAPYLWGTTYFAYEACAGKFLLIPCLHDESYARLAIVGDMLRGARGVLFNAYAEAELAQRLVGPLERWTVVGMGFVPDPPGDDEGFRRRHKLRGPVLLSVGRREGGKNVPLLIDSFLRYKGRRGGDLLLVQAGTGDVGLPRRPDVVDLKPDWSQRDAMYRAGTIFCQPSVNESLSIVLMQAWLAGRPVLVHARAAVTRDHCARSDGGLWFANYAEFEEILDRLLADPDLRDSLGANGREYVRTVYSPEAVLERFHQAAYEWLGEPALARAR